MIGLINHVGLGVGARAQILDRAFNQRSRRRKLHAGLLADFSMVEGTPITPIRRGMLAKDRREFHLTNDVEGLSIALK